MAELPAKIHLTVVTREQKILELDVDEVVVPAAKGALGVLPGHTPLLAALKIGDMMYRQGEKHWSLVLSWGFAEILPDRVIVIAEGAMRLEEIDAAEADRFRREAERELASLADHDEGFALAEAELDRSISQIAAMPGRH